MTKPTEASIIYSACRFLVATLYDENVSVEDKLEVARYILGEGMKSVIPAVDTTYPTTMDDTSEDDK